ncbi:hypothetical protein B0H14DRAFT_1330639 [Mycena olivaceomarginata]|nr:hypothetical protein B0H14DRAFT_1330639 [Mycena olivaceomarginata]
MIRVIQSMSLRPPLPKLPYRSSLRTPCLRDSTSDCHVHSCIFAYSVPPSSQTALAIRTRQHFVLLSHGERPHERATHVHRHLDASLRARDDAPGVAVLPHAGEADWAARGKCGILAIVTQDGASRGAVSRWCGGSSYDKYPVSAERVNEGLVDVFDEKGWDIFIHYAEDGSGVGSAIIPSTY